MYRNDRMKPAAELTPEELEQRQPSKPNYIMGQLATALLIESLLTSAVNYEEDIKKSIQLSGIRDADREEFAQGIKVLLMQEVGKMRDFVLENPALVPPGIDSVLLLAIKKLHNTKVNFSIIATLKA